MSPVSLKFFLAHNLETLGMPWREENKRRRGEREEREKDGAVRGGMNGHIAFLVHILLRKLYLVKICGDLMCFITAIKAPFFHLVTSYPHLVERIRPFYSVVFTCLQLPKAIMFWCLGQDYNDNC